MGISLDLLVLILQVEVGLLVGHWHVHGLCLVLVLAPLLLPSRILLPSTAILSGGIIVGASDCDGHGDWGSSLLGRGDQFRKGGQRVGRCHHPHCICGLHVLPLHILTLTAHHLPLIHRSDVGRVVEVGARAGGFKVGGVMVGGLSPKGLVLHLIQLEGLLGGGASLHHLIILGVLGRLLETLLVLADP